MFQALTLRGRQATLVWGYRTLAQLTSWRLARRRAADGQAWHWTLAATLGPVDTFQAQRALARRELLFRPTLRLGGQYVWPVQTLTLGTTSLRATLGPPEG